MHGIKKSNHFNDCLLWGVFWDFVFHGGKLKGVGVETVVSVRISKVFANGLVPDQHRPTINGMPYRDCSTPASNDNVALFKPLLPICREGIGAEFGIGIGVHTFQYAQVRVSCK